MRGKIDNEKDLSKVSKADEKRSNWIKFENANNYIRLLSKDFVSEFVHTLQLGEKKYVNFVCLGGLESGGYAPDKCPVCAKAKEYWDKMKKMKSDPKFTKSKKFQIEVELVKKDGKALQTSKKTVMIAVRGDVQNGKIIFEDSAKFLPISKAQWDKLTGSKNEGEIFHDYEFMKDSNDLINRTINFQKLAKKGKGGKGNYTEVMIKPSKHKTEKPVIENELPEIEDAFNYMPEEEIEKVLNTYLENRGDDLDDVDIESTEEQIEGNEGEETEIRRAKEKSKKEESEFDEVDEERLNKGKKKSKDDDIDEDF